jgi:NTP pyrophosphatase (non-canonical NTP hydrolase)
MDLSEYQRAARLTDQADTGDPASLVIPALGLVSEAGSLLNILKKYLRDGISWSHNREFVKQELGDILWYLAALATRLDIDLSEVANENLRRAKDRFGHTDRADAIEVTEALDATFPPKERFPDRMVFGFKQKIEDNGRTEVSITVESSEPNPFESGTEQDAIGKRIGFSLGDPLTDNARGSDEYRFHDAFHIAFMAVLGWSPVMRQLLRLKRKSNAKCDETEDGARAKDIEEGLSTYLFTLAESHLRFQDPRHVGNDILDHVLGHTRALEVSRRPAWLWKEAISLGFQMWQQLAENRGGFVLADRIERRVRYSKLSPDR